MYSTNLISDKNYDFYFGVKGQGHRYYKYNFLTTGSFPHHFSSVYWIFTKLDHMIVLWTGKNPFYFGVIRSKVTVIINIIFDNRIASA
jgi:hypothetical protein